MPQLRFLDYQYSLHRKKKLMSKWLFRKRDKFSFESSSMFQSDRNEMKRVFQRIDADNDGLISRGDLTRLLKALRAPDFETTVERIMWVSEACDTGFIPFAKFIEINRNVGAGEIRAAFRYFDWDGDEMISVEDLRMAMECLGENCSGDDCRRMIRRLNKSDGEMVSMNDFMAMMTVTLEPMSLRTEG